MARTSLSGFPEWLPEGRIIEMHVLDVLRRVFELHGFVGIETRAVETGQGRDFQGDLRPRSPSGSEGCSVRTAHA